MPTKTPDDIIQDLGGCGHYQIRMVVLTHVIKSAICFTWISMLITVKTPDWWCDDVSSAGNGTPNNSIDLAFKSCTGANGSACSVVSFDDSLNTIVSEFYLICDRAFVPSTIMSIQAFGMLIGNPLSGQLADLFGRKMPYFLSLVMLLAANLTIYFSPSLVVFTVCRFIIGLANGFFLTVQYNLMAEFSLARWRTWIVGFPSWPIQSCLFAFIAWFFDDWRDLHLIVAICSGACLFAWWTIPESFRWYLAHEKIEKAEKVLKKVAKVNKHPMPDFKSLFTEEDMKKPDRKYTFIHLFKTRYFVMVTLLSAINWFGLGFCAYGLNYGIQALSGNIYLNIFLFNITTLPSKAIGSVLLNRIGRKYTSLIAFILTAAGGLVAGIITYTDISKRDIIINWSAIVSNMGIQMAWGSVQTWTVELYPTVIRNIGFGSLSTIGRVGGMLGPQMVYLDSVIPGIMFFTCGAVAVVCMLGLMFLPETVNIDLTDKLEDKRREHVKNTELTLIGDTIK